MEQQRNSYDDKLKKLEAKLTECYDEIDRIPSEEDKSIMWKLSNLIYEDYPQAENTSGILIPAKPLNEDFRSFKKRIKEAWAVFKGQASAFTWD